MILREVCFTDYYAAMEFGLYFIIIGYYFLLFFYFLLMRFRTSKKPYWLFFSLLFLCLAAGRVFFQAYYFFAPNMTNASDNEIVNTMLLMYRLATFFTWMGIACLMGVLGILLLPPGTEIDEKNAKGEKPEVKKIGPIELTENVKLSLRILLIVIPIIVGIVVLTIPAKYIMDPALLKEYKGASMDKEDIVYVNFFGRDYPVGRVWLNFILLPILVFIIPFLFLYLALKTYGVLRKSYFLNFIGFLLYFIGRIAQGALYSMGALHTAAILPPMLILLSLLIIVIGNNYEQLK